MKKPKLRLIKSDTSANTSVKKREAIYNCPRCGTPVYIDDMQLIMDGICYCWECSRPKLFDVKSFEITNVAPVADLERWLQNEHF